MAMKFTGFVCLSDIPKELIKAVPCKDGVTRMFIGISVHESKEPMRDANGKITSDHFISCAPKKEERVEGKNYICGNLKTWVENPQANIPSAADIAAAGAADAEMIGNLPF